jgi:3-oxo-5alpha-steroid 4-dehydrogenase
MEIIDRGQFVLRSAAVVGSITAMSLLGNAANALAEEDSSKNILVPTEMSTVTDSLSSSDAHQKVANGDLPEKWDKEADIVVVGAGAGGCAAACAALEGGASALVVEMRSYAGGDAIWNSGEIACGGSSVQKACGYNATPEDYRAFLHAVGTDGVPEELLDVFIEQGPELIDWLQSIGVEFVPHSEEFSVMPYVDLDNGVLDNDMSKNCGLEAFGNEFHPRYIGAWNGNPEPVVHLATNDSSKEAAPFLTTSMDSGHSGTGFMLPMIRFIKENGGEILLETRGMRVYKDENGRVAGIMAQSSDGGTLNIKANKGVVLAGGCWLGDPELVKRYTGKWQYVNVAPLTMDEGGAGALWMGIDAGGNVVNGDSMWSMQSVGFFQSSQLADSRSPLSHAIIVDENGSRFCAEDEYTPGTSDRELSKIRDGGYDRQGQIWIILDQEYFDKLQQFLEIANMQAYFTAGDTLVEADSVEELAEKLDTPFLPTQIEMYNKAAEQEGSDPQFCRKPEDTTPLVAPLYACPIRDNLFMNYSHGGLDIDVNGRVLDENGSPIEGLYAAGRTARSICEGRHDASTGMSCSPAMVMGRVIGKVIAQQ